MYILILLAFHLSGITESLPQTQRHHESSTREMKCQKEHFHFQQISSGIQYLNTQYLVNSKGHAWCKTKTSDFSYIGKLPRKQWRTDKKIIAKTLSKTVTPTEKTPAQSGYAISSMGLQKDCSSSKRLALTWGTHLEFKLKEEGQTAFSRSLANLTDLRRAAQKY